MIKSILVPATGSDGDRAMFESALQVAEAFAAHLDVLHVRLDPVQMAVAMTSEASGMTLVERVIEALDQSAREREAKAQRIFDAFIAAHGLTLADAPTGAPADKPSAQWHVQSGDEPFVAVGYGFGADLIVAGRPAGDEGLSRATLEALLFETGRPLLIPGAAPPAGPIDRIAIGWKPTAAAVRAVAAALPFLARAAEIVVITVEEAEGGRSEAQQLIGNLAWHGLRGVARTVRADGQSPAETLLAAAAESANLLVMGGYGHSRLREWIFGGFTQRVLEDAPIPVLLMH
jgi:nucleotide-binding universal stress UspA family protein